MNLTEYPIRVCPVCGVQRSTRYFRGDKCLLCAGPTPTIETDDIVARANRCRPPNEDRIRGLQ